MRRVPIEVSWRDNVVPVTESGCWLWLGAVDRDGYGFRGTRKNGVYSHVLMHRWSYANFIGQIPPKMCVCHRCDVPCCVNPEHLFVASNIENTYDRTRKGRSRNGYMGATHCKHGHEFTPENTRIRPNGGRECRACARIRVRLWTREYMRRKRKDPQWVERNNLMQKEWRRRRIQHGRVS